MRGREGWERGGGRGGERRTGGGLFSIHHYTYTHHTPLAFPSLAPRRPSTPFDHRRLLSNSKPESVKAQVAR